ncbi:glycosyltransferase family 2 protein [Pedobacter boryungensis]|uniref:Glycosyltransferase family 2 protein n=1 Tax=Pedobacter boryungensis TaxID=869962 RepID=A0ABX2DCC1_9SPHI|nr:glycosyltransferase family 2 protein [Pedobacter boryungensis]NQX31726.1 glycosyltransferase family 2 protein [Pedobacter boryungensis]
MNNNTYKVSIIVPCYNQAKYLEQCFSSLINQTYANWECILVDDGSTDHTEKVGKEWAQKDARIKYYKKSNGGLSSARNFGLNHITGDFIQFLDADDFLAPSKFEKSLSQVTVKDNTVIITNFLLFDDNKQKEKPAYCKLEQNCFNQEAILMEWDKRFTIPINCALFPSNLTANYLFREDLKAKEDWIFWLQIYQHEPQTIFINEPLAFYRENTSGMTRKDDFMFENKMKAIKIIEQIINKPSLFNTYLRYNNDYLLHENHKQLKQIKLLKHKRTFKYKLEKLLRPFTGKKD